MLERRGDEFPEPHFNFLSEEPPREPKKPGDRLVVLGIVLVTVVLPVVFIGCVAIFGRHS